MSSVTWCGANAPPTRVKTPLQAPMPSPADAAAIMIQTSDRPLGTAGEINGRRNYISGMMSYFGWGDSCSFRTGRQGGSGGGAFQGYGGADGAGEGPIFHYDIKAENIVMKTFTSPETTPSAFTCREEHNCRLDGDAADSLVRCTQSTAFTEFLMPWILPYVHFIPVPPDLADWQRRDGMADQVLTDAQTIAIGCGADGVSCAVGRGPGGFPSKLRQERDRSSHHVPKFGSPAAGDHLTLRDGRKAEEGGGGDSYTPADPIPAHPNPPIVLMPHVMIKLFHRIALDVECNSVFTTSVDVLIENVISSDWKQLSSPTHALHLAVHQR
ncbi:hypothetical protein C8R45DRAFT_935652 [Mycena sanguinolenta]|nr:hypothetical protein C8R45DRAFT_935652 [Mycena sanguinolenta]